MGIGFFNARQKFLSRPAFVANSDVIDALQSQSFLPYGYCHPQHPLIVFKSIPGDPGGATRELNGIEYDKNITKVRSAEKTGERCKIWPAAGYNHGLTIYDDILQKAGMTLNRANRN